MLLPRLREEVLEANLELVRRGLVLYTFGNASGISRDQNLVVIKPSGVPYEAMKPEHLVVTDLEGKIVEGSLRPSSDLPRRPFRSRLDVQPPLRLALEGAPSSMASHRMTYAPSTESQVRPL